MHTLYDNIPLTLRQKHQWVCWALEEREGKPTKVPKTVELRNASATNPATWARFKDVVAAAEKHGIGIGFVFADDCAVTGLDLDHVLDVEGNLAAEYEWVVREAETYTEVSPSGDGLHLFFLNGKPRDAAKCRKGQPEGRVVEMYDHNRFFTVTGKVFTDSDGATHDVICSNPGVLAKVYETFIDDEQKSESPGQRYCNRANQTAVSLDDVQLLEKMFSAKNGNEAHRLWDGDVSGYGGDESAADLALCNQLAFWTGGDSSRMDALFRRSGLMRPKWDERRGEKTYGEMTIDRAISDAVSFYDPEYADVTVKPAEGCQDGSIETDDSVWDNPHLEWKKDKNGNVTGVAAPTVPALVWWMKTDPGLKGVRLEGMSQQVTLENGLPWNDAAKLWQTVDDDYLFARMQERYKFAGKAVVKSDKSVFMAFSIFSHDNRYDLLEETIGRLPEWDGVLRKDSLFIDFLGAENTEYTREVTALFLRAALARAFDPGCKYDYMVVLQGRQGIGKSTLLRKLALRDDFFADDIKNIGTKDAQELIQGRWIIEMAELAAFKGARLESLKSFITSQTDSYRVPYAKRPQQMPRRCVLAGTTNQHEYLEDPTGNRRFLPVICEGVRNRDVFANDTDEYLRLVWAEALVDYRANPSKSLVLPNSVLSEADEKREDATTEDPWIGLVTRFLDGRKEGECVCTMQILTEGIGVDRKDVKTQDNMRVSQIIRKHCTDWKKTPSNRVIIGYGSQRAFEKVKPEPVSAEGVQQCLPGV